MLKGKHIVLGITGGIAAYKSAQLLRLLVKRGAEVQVILTPSGREFITPVTLSALSGRPVITEFFSANTGEWHSHVDLGLWADLMVIAPATANTLAKMAHGVADNMLVTTYLSAKEHVMVAPAMDLDMMAHPTTLRNLEILRRDGVEIIEAASGELASHLVGKGRMEEPEGIVERIERYFVRQEEADDKPLSGRRILITAGPTHERLDPVRYIGNCSSGKTGVALATEAVRLGAEVVLVTGPLTVSIPEDSRIRRVQVVSALEMHDAVMREIGSCDSAIMAAAVADYRPLTCEERKIKREGVEKMSVELVRNPDIAASVGAVKGDRVLVGFALESDNELEHALGKMERKNLDWIVVNSLREGACFNADENKISILGREGGRKDFPMKPKGEMARDILMVCLAGRG